MSCKPTYKGVRYNSLEELYRANGINEQQKQKAQQKFQEYVNATGKQDIEGFKKFVNGTQETTLAPKGTINVYWGQAESDTSTKLLSNLAPRKFTWEGREYGSVEHAYQSNKSGTFDKATYDKYVKAGGYGTKIKGKGTVAEMKAADSLGLMKKLVVESFKQNPNSNAAKKLLQYENFTHNTNELIDKAFLEGLKLAQQELLGSKQDIEGFKEFVNNKSSQVENIEAQAVNWNYKKAGKNLAIGDVVEVVYSESTKPEYPYFLNFMVDGVPNINNEEKSLKLALKGLTPEEKISFCNHFGITMTEENGKKC